MLQRIKIVQIIILTVFVCLLISGCKKNDNILTEEFSVKQEEYTDDMISFIGNGQERSDLGILNKTKDGFVNWLDSNNLNNFNGFINNLDNGFIPFLKENARDTIDYLDNFLGALIEKFNIGEEESE